MGKNKDVKFVYAQSSDIKPRKYIEYRKDMKKKAIAELEIKEWLKEKFKEKYRGKDIVVEKFGGDKFLWFLREGKITREPDFIVYINQKEKKLIEFQYADKEDLQFFDFKVSKVAKKKGKDRIPHKDRNFFYILKNSLKYALIDPEWILANGEIGTVPAWGNREAYRVPKDKFDSILIYDETLKNYIEVIEAKINILEFQYCLISIWENDLAKELQKVIDEKKLVKIIPETLEAFFKVCFVLDHLDKTPENKNLWLVYLLSYINNQLTLKEIAMVVYSLDFLYSNIPPGELQSNELKELENKLKFLVDHINKFYYPEQGLYMSSIKESPLEETRYALFSINIIEDIIQDAIYYYNANLEPITKIYQYIREPIKVANNIRSENKHCK